MSSPSEKQPAWRRLQLRTWASGMLCGERWRNTTRRPRRYGFDQNALYQFYQKSFQCCFTTWVDFQWRIHQPWELASERWCASPNIQPHEMSCRASGHHWSNVWTHEAWKCRLVCVAKRLFNIYDIFCPYTSLTVPLKPCQLCALRTWKGTTIFLAHNLMELKEFGKKHRLDSVVILKRLSPYIPLLSIVGFSIARRQQMKLSFFGPSGCSLTTTAKPPGMQVRSKRHLGCWN